MMTPQGAVPRYTELVTEETLEERQLRIGDLLDRGLDIHGNPIDFVRIGNEAFRVHIEQLRKDRRAANLRRRRKL